MLSGAFYESDSFSGSPAKMRSPRLIQYRQALYRLVSAERLPRLPSRIRQYINGQIAGLVSGLVTDIPLTDIAEVLRTNGLVMLQEDDTEWAGMLLGREGQVDIPLATVDQVSPDGQHLGHIDHVLHLTWYRYDTGRYDVTAYVSL